MAKTEKAKRRTFKQREIVQKEIVHVIPTGDGEEFRFSVIEIDGEKVGDMRFFERGRKEDIMLPQKRGIPYPESPDEFLKGFKKLGEKLTG